MSSVFQAALQQSYGLRSSDSCLPHVVYKLLAYHERVSLPFQAPPILIRTHTHSLPRLGLSYLFLYYTLTYIFWLLLSSSIISLWLTSL